MVTNVPGDSVFPGDDGFRASPHKEYVPSMFYVENKEVECTSYTFATTSLPGIKIILLKHMFRIQMRI